MVDPQPRVINGELEVNQMDEKIVESVLDEMRERKGDGDKGAVNVIEVAPPESVADGVLYVRVGREDQGVNSVEQQVRRLAEFCASASLEPRLIIESRGVSGTRNVEEQPDFAALIDAVSEGCRWVAVTDFSRLARTHCQMAQMLRGLRERHVRILCPNVDIAWEHGPFAARIVEELSAAYCEEMRRSLNRFHERPSSRGAALGSAAVRRVERG